MELNSYDFNFVVGDAIEKQRMRISSYQERRICVWCVAMANSWCSGSLLSLSDSISTSFRVLWYPNTSYFILSISDLTDSVKKKNIFFFLY